VKLQEFSYRQLGGVRRLAWATLAFVVLCAWPLVLFRLRVFGG
jgi:hypothetical protein